MSSFPYPIDLRLCILLKPMRVSRIKFEKKNPATVDKGHPSCTKAENTSRRKFEFQAESLCVRDL